MAEEGLGQRWLDLRNDMDDPRGWDPEWSAWRALSTRALSVWLKKPKDTHIGRSASPRLTVSPNIIQCVPGVVSALGGWISSKQL